MSEKKVDCSNAADAQPLEKFRFMTVGELLAQPGPDASTRRATEEAYRRGYLHGYSNGMDDVLKASQARRYSAQRAWGLVAWFFDGPLTRWLYADHRGRFEPPPLFSAKADYREGEQ